MATIIIAKNVTLSIIEIEDLGIPIDATSQITLTSIFTKGEIIESKDLDTQVLAGNIVINNGTIDLGIVDGIKHVNFETEYEDFEGVIDTLSELNDVNISAPIDGQLLSYNGGTSLWGAISQRGYTVDTGSPDSTSVLWFNPTTHYLYFYDVIRNAWLSVNRNLYTFSRGGNADASYLTVGGWTTSTYYHIPLNATIMSVWCRARSGPDTKSLTIRSDGVDVFTFSLAEQGDLSLLYQNIDVDISLSGDTLLEVFVDQPLQPIKDAICQLQIAWGF